jgi:hypothetical protein
MTRRQFSISETLWNRLVGTLFTTDLAENFAFGLARPFRRRWGLLYVLEDVAKVRRQDYEGRSGGGLTLNRSTSNKVNAIARDAAKAGLIPVHFHSHPPGCHDFSGYDDAHEAQLHEWLRRKNQPLLISVVIPYGGTPTARLWVEGGTETLGFRKGLQPMSGYAGQAPDALDRQRAFGPGLSAAARALSVAIVGTGGIGMLVAEQLVRCGFRRFVLIDEDKVDLSNLNRLNGTFAGDVGQRKVVIASRLIHQCAASLGTRADVEIFADDIYCAGRRTQELIRQCDLVIALTDNQLSRIRTLRLAMEGAAEFLSAGVDIRLTGGGTIGGLYAEIVSGERYRFCPVCAGRLDLSEAAIEARRYVGGIVAEHAVREGYLPNVSAPSVMSLNSTAAGMLCLEIQRRVSGLGQRDFIQVDWQSGGIRTVERGDDVLREACEVCGRRGGSRARDEQGTTDTGEVARDIR